MTVSVTSIGSLFLIGELKDKKLVNPSIVIFDIPRSTITFIDFGFIIGDIDLNNYPHVVLDDESELAKAFRRHKLGLTILPAGGFGSA